MSFERSLKPFLNKQCTLRITKALGEDSEPYWGQTWRLFIFDWSKTEDDVREAIRENAGWEGEDIPVFAVLNPAKGENDLENILARVEESTGIAGKSGFFFLNEGYVYVGDGDFWPFCADLDAFIAALTA